MQLSTTVKYLAKDRHIITLYDRLSNRTIHETMLLKSNYPTYNSFSGKVLHLVATSIAMHLNSYLVQVICMLYTHLRESMYTINSLCVRLKFEDKL